MKPVIDPATSILGYPRHVEFVYQPAASNTPDKWTCSNLPADLVIDASTGKISGAVTTAGVYVCTLIAEASVASPTIDATANTIGLTAHGLANGDRVYFTSAGGSVPAGLTANTVYFVVNTATDSFKVAATLGGAAIDLTGTGSGIITVHQLSDDFDITIGIDSAPSESVATLLVEANTRRVFQPDGQGGWSPLFNGTTAIPALWLKLGDVVPLAVRFSIGKDYIDLPLTSFKLTLKQFEPEKIVLTAGGATEGTDFLRVTGATAALTYYLLVATIDGDEIKNAVAENEEDAGTFAYFLAEVEWELPNTYGIGADPIVARSRTFIVGIERNIDRAV